ncbi:acyltransferase family protein [Nonomuraea sp. NPDC049309]|uniref:acyltransferase family protein n=1 Tax=Nonomuraea sp. NPDC049309 TaxID=3364350 RepID=UPI003711D855
MSAATSSPVSPPALTSAGRLAWLDALRGIGALAVVAEHMLPWFLPSLRPYWFSLGVYGILVFFLVSGYIIPASLERHGDVRAFWISRFFRLYPLYLAVIAVVLALSWWAPVREAVVRDGSAVAAHATMLLDVVGIGGVADTMWTLSYEMVFYLVVTALFLTRGHERSGTWAIVFAVAAVLVGLVASGAVFGGGWPAYVSCAVFVLGLTGVLTGRLRRLSACALGVMAVACLLLSSRVPWLGAAVLAVMFAGTAIYRWERGTGPLWPVAVTGALVVIAPVWAIESGWWWVQADVWLTTILLAAATFAGGMALRGRRLPRILVWFGLISYSLYLVHHPLLRYFVLFSGDLRGEPLAYQLVMSAAALALIIAVSAVTYRFVEKPMQDLGRRISRRCRGGLQGGGEVRVPREGAGDDRVLRHEERQVTHRVSDHVDQGESSG